MTFVRENLQARGLFFSSNNPTLGIMTSIAKIDDPSGISSKPFLGGYRNKITEIRYYNAASQTGPRHVERQNASTRETQFAEISEAGTQTIRHRATQTLRKDLYISNLSDVHKTAGRYENHEGMKKRRDLDGHARTIQKSYRAYRLLKFIKDSSREYKNKLEECGKLEIERAENLRKRHENEIIRQTFPRSRGDFDKLYIIIDRWRTSRLDEAKKRLFAGSLRAENYRVLEKTTEMLRSLEKHRRSTLLEKREIKRTRFFTKHCKPIKWHGYKAIEVEMITVRVQKALEYKCIYDKLTNDDKSVEERMELLMLLKNSLKNHDCATVENFIFLIDQEIDLLSNDVESTWLNNLRQRISIAYLNFVNESGRCTCVDIENPSDLKFSDASPAVAASTKKLLCKSCLKILPYKSFSAHVRMKKLSCCLSCSWLRQQTIDKTDYGPYKFLLNGIRADEQKRNCYSSLLYVIREPGIHHLVNNIWHGHSIVSENDDIFNLRLVRFNIDEEWSPWNCILLTTEEAETHYFVENFEAFYSKRLLHKIHLAHQIAKTHFNDLITFERKFRVSSRFYMIQDRKDYVPCASED